MVKREDNKWHLREKFLDQKALIAKHTAEYEILNV